MKSNLPSILVVDDDDDDCLNTRAAFLRNHVQNELHFVSDGSEMLDYLQRQGKYASASMPGIILLDLNMPRIDGRDALRLLKANAALQRIPVVILTTSKDPSDVDKCYALGASSFVVKPASFDALVALVGGLCAYWLQLVELPGAIWTLP